MFSARTAALCLLAAGISANARSAERFSFEPAPRVLEKGRDPQLAVRESGDLFLLRVDGGNLWLQTSSDGGDSFGPGVRVNEDDVSAHAESTPQMVVRSMHEFYCLWESRSAQGHTSLRFSRSTNWGKSFGKSIAVDPSSTATQAFYSMAVAPDGTIVVVWLDGRNMGRQGKPDTFGVYVARSADHGQSFQKSQRVALDACPCCRPSVAAARGGEVYVSWRGVFKNDVRDMLVASSRDGGASFTSGSRVADDDWHLNGCPHAGDTMIVLNGRLFVCWHTVRDGQRWLYLAWSDDHGMHFSHRVDAAGGVLDANHARFVNLGGTAGLVFQGRPMSGDAGWGKLNIYFRQVTASGSLLPLQCLGHASGSATYPTVTYESPNHLFVVWTERSDAGPSVAMSRGRFMPENRGGGNANAH